MVGDSNGVFGLGFGPVLEPLVPLCAVSFCFFRIRCVCVKWAEIRENSISCSLGQNKGNAGLFRRFTTRYVTFEDVHMLK